MAALAGKGIMKLIGASTGKTIGFLTSGKARKIAKGVSKVAKKVAPAARVAGEVYGAYKNNKSKAPAEPQMATAGPEDNYGFPPARNFAGTGEANSRRPTTKPLPRPRPAGPVSGAAAEAAARPTSKAAAIAKFKEDRQRRRDAGMKKY